LIDVYDRLPVGQCEAVVKKDESEVMLRDREFVDSSGVYFDLPSCGTCSSFLCRSVRALDCECGCNVFAFLAQRRGTCVSYTAVI
jgi:hypothetical protein